jgi:hypothetical protein
MSTSRRWLPHNGRHTTHDPPDRFHLLRRMLIEVAQVRERPAAAVPEHARYGEAAPR